MVSVLGHARLASAGAADGTGNDLDNTLYAGAGDNRLDGGAGTDTVSYVYATAAVTVSLASEAAQATGSSGTDTLIRIENLTGSNYNDQLTGNGLDNVLNGGNGNDLLIGGMGNDILTGGAGQDIFRFDALLNSASNRDTIRDFNVRDDTIELDRGIFTALSEAGTLDPHWLRAGTGCTSAADSDDYVIYNKTTGALYYDADADGPGDAVQIATLSSGLALTNLDFLVV